LTSGTGIVGFGTKSCCVPRTTANMAAKVMIVIASIRIRRNLKFKPYRQYEAVHKKTFSGVEDGDSFEEPQRVNRRGIGELSDYFDSWVSVSTVRLHREADGDVG
jgi:hypothetical protein